MKRQLSLFAGYFFFSTLFFYFSCIQTYKPTGLACRTDPDCWGDKDHFCDTTKNICALLSKKTDGGQERTTEDTNKPDESPPPDEPASPESLAEVCASPPETSPKWPYNTFNCKNSDFCKSPSTCVAASVGAVGPGKPFNAFGACTCTSCPSDCPAPFFRCAKVIDESVSPPLIYFGGNEVCMKSCDTDSDCPAEMACSRLVNVGKICISLELMGMPNVLTQDCVIAAGCPGTTTQIQCCRKGTLVDKECRSAFVIKEGGLPCVP